MANFEDVSAKSTAAFLIANNYDNWQHRMKTMLLKKQYWTIVMERGIVEKNATSEEKFAFLQRSNIALSTIVTCVDDNCLGVACDTES